MFLGKNKSQYKRAYYLTELDETPKHIKYRYYADLEDGNIKTIGLECVTKIGEDYVSFKDIFKVNPEKVPNRLTDIKDHVDLFLNILNSTSPSVVYE